MAQEIEDGKLKEAKDTLKEIGKLKIIFNKEADEKDQLYGSITKKEIISRVIFFIINFYLSSENNKKNDS